ncbi:MAG: hypothetical protein LBR43_00575 [Spiroplasmataceae bacterium]|jgi:hypothetical protein|nr:hypothetical protein [Spiroplasmataceae bacterium]
MSNLLKLSVTRTWGNRALPVNSSAWKDLRNQVLKRDNNTCRFCETVLEKYLICDHIDGNASNNNPNNLGINCPGCDAIRHCGFSGMQDWLILRKSSLNQDEIVRRTYDFYLKNGINSSPEEIDPACQKIFNHSFKLGSETVYEIDNPKGEEVSSVDLANLLLLHDYEEIRGIENIKGFFTPKFSLERFLKQKLQQIEIPPKK